MTAASSKSGTSAPPGSSAGAAVVYGVTSTPPRSTCAGSMQMTDGRIIAVRWLTRVVESGAVGERRGDGGSPPSLPTA